MKDPTICESHSWTFPFLSPGTAAVLAVLVVAAAASAGRWQQQWCQCWRGSGISGIGSGSGVGVGGGSSSVGGSSGRGVGGGGSKGGSINNSIEGGGSVVVVIADLPPDIDSDSDYKFFDALSDSHCVECQIEYLGSHFDHCDLDSESGQSSNESELDDNGLDEFVEQNTVNKIYIPLSTKRSQSITEHKCKRCTKNTNSYMRFYLIPIHIPS